MCVILTVVILCCGISAYSEEAKEKYAVYINVLPMLIGQLNIHGELAVSERISLFAGGGYRKGDFFGFEIDNTEIITTFYKAGLGFYPAGQQLRGIYALPTIVLNRITVRDKLTDESGSVTLNTIGVEFGHKWLWKGGVIFDLSIGVGVISEAEVTYGKQKKRIEVERTGLTHVGIQFGYAW